MSQTHIISMVNVFTMFSPSSFNVHVKSIDTYSNVIQLAFEHDDEQLCLHTTRAADSDPSKPRCSISRSLCDGNPLYT
jgi:hypothetical protein